MLKEYLSEYGFNVFVTQYPEEVLEIIYKNKIELVLMDILMPSKNGFEIFKEIKDKNFEGGFIFLSSKNLEKDKIEGLKLGADDYITKPFNLEELVLRIHKIINQKNSINSTPIKDSLTQVYTKEHFYKNFRKEISCLSKNNQHLFSVALLDINNFRTVNRDNGYLAGDIVLIEFASTLQSIYPKSDIYRFEGDKFIVVFKDIDSPDVYYSISQLLNTVSAKNFKTINNSLTFSSAICTIKNPDENLENIIQTLFETLSKSKKIRKEKISVIGKISEPKKHKILIIEDLSVTAYLIKKYLERLNCEIIFASDGVEGLNKCIKEKPDIVLLDLMLPKMNGYQVCKKIKENPETKELKIIVLSSKNSKNDIMKCYNMGIDDYISKPFSMSILVERIQYLF
jgi:diguanylate cyclase (GGDEF)-like protein